MLQVQAQIETLTIERQVIESSVSTLNPIQRKAGFSRLSSIRRELAELSVERCGCCNVELQDKEQVYYAPQENRYVCLSCGAYLCDGTLTLDRIRYSA